MWCVSAVLCALAFASSSKSAEVSAARAGRVAESASSRRYTLRAEATWQINLPSAQPFDASGLLLLPDGRLLTHNDRAASIYEIQFLPETNSAKLLRLTNIFSAAQLAPFAKEKVGRYDAEGLARDEQDRIYLCEESNRWILRYDSQSREVERLKIDWSPVQKYFTAADPNASFEGIAAGNGRLYVANERNRGRIIVVDLKTLAVIDDFAVGPGTAANAHDVHYSDLSYCEDALFVLLRHSRCVLKVDPKSHDVLAEYSFQELETNPDVVYRTLLPTGAMEGLAVDREFIWLVTDNNGLARLRYPKDTRPTLFKCRRPDR